MYKHYNVVLFMFIKDNEHLNEDGSVGSGKHEREISPWDFFLG